MLVATVVAVALTGCGSGGGDVSAQDAKAREDARIKLNQEALEKNPPAPGTGPSN